MALLLCSKTLQKRREVAISGYEQNQSRRPDLQPSRRIKLNHLPAEVLLDILSRLPLTSLLQAKFTCKLWLGIINDPTFPDLHLIHALKQHPGHLYSLPGPPKFYFVDKPLDAAVGVKLPLSLGDLLPEAYNKDFTSSGGLLCYRFSAADPFYICNPVVPGETHVKIPGKILEKGSLELAWGFGYAPLTKKYKLIQCSGIRLQPDQPRRFRPETWVHALGEECWREVAHFPLAPSGPQVYCKGSIYWTTADLHGKFESRKHIVSFNLDTETFRARQALPSDYGVKKCEGGVCIAAVGETVALTTCSRNNIYDVWMLIDEAQDIWVQKYKYVFPAIPGQPEYFGLLGVWMNKEESYGLQQVYRRGSASIGTSVGWAVKQYLVHNIISNTFAEPQLPFGKDVLGNFMSPTLVINHVGTLVSPPKIVADAKHPSLSLSLSLYIY